MADGLIFHMGKFQAVLPIDRRYCRNHMWCLQDRNGHRFGFTAFAVRLMQDVYFLEWTVDEGTSLAQLQTIGHLETSKATADLFAPIAGTMLKFNQALLNDPSAINLDNYGEGWLFEMDGATTATLSAEEYHHFLDENWEKTQRSIKGHI
jgi:glycine cleavage system H protein